VASFQFGFVTDGYEKRLWKRLETARTSFDGREKKPLQALSIEVIDESKQRNTTFYQPSVNNRYRTVFQSSIKLPDYSSLLSLTRSLH
jgi:hypothetical protein